ncbi:MAG: cation:proton antiporter [Kiritimatiellia bacterium]
MLLTILRLFTFLVGLVVAGLITVPRFLRHVARHNSDEMLLITTLALCFGTALLAVRMEFSVALGAFIMGAIIAEAREAPRVERLMAPVRDLFLAVFFVAIGMLIQPSDLLANLAPILAITLVFVTAKLAACAAGAFITGRDLSSSLRIGANMAQLGEFAFVLAAAGRQWKVTGDFLYPVIAGVTVLNAVLRPYLIEAADPLAGFLRRNLPDSWVSAMTVFNRRVREMGPARRRNPMMRHVRSLAFQIGLNLTLIAAGFITGAMIAGRFPQLLAPLPGRLGRTQVVPWLLIAVLLLPLYVATIRKMQAMGLLLSELAMEGASAGSPARPFLGHLLSGTMFLLQLVLLGLVTLLVSATMLPSWQTFLVLLVITGGLAAIFGNLFNRHYTRAKVALLETWCEPARRPEPEEMPGPHEELQTVVVSDHPAVTGMRNGEIVALSRLGVSLVAIRRSGVNLLHPAPTRRSGRGTDCWSWERPASLRPRDNSSAPAAPASGRRPPSSFPLAHSRHEIYSLIRKTGYMSPSPLILFKALADDTRLRVLRCTGLAELSVAELVAVLALPQSTVSRHLKPCAKPGWWKRGGTGRP